MTSSVRLTEIMIILMSFSQSASPINILSDRPFPLQVKNYRLNVSLFGTEQMLHIVVLEIVLEQDPSNPIDPTLIIFENSLNFLDSYVVSMIDILASHFCEVSLNRHLQAQFPDYFLHQWTEFALHRKEFKELPQNIWMTVSSLFLDHFNLFWLFWHFSSPPFCNLILSLIFFLSSI